MKSYLRSLILIPLSGLLLTSDLYGLEIETHKTLNETIAQSTMNGFSLNQYLINNVGFRLGIDELIYQNIKIADWIKNGGQYEDKPPLTFNPNTWVPYVRSANHFHNPIKSINEAGFAGVWGTELISGKSAISWAQSSPATQSPGGFYSWKDARMYYYNALVAATPDARSKYFADTFRGLGQLMHLLQDMSVPAHTRNEGHYVNYMYENWVKNNANVVSDVTATPVFMVYTLLTQQPSAFSEAPIPIANLFSTNTYKGAASIAMSDTTVGLAEWTNANFFSEDTINLPSTYGYPTTSFPFPNFGDTNLIDYLQQRAVPKTIVAPNGAPDTGIWVQKINARNEIEIVHFAKFGYTTIPMANLTGQPEKLGRTFILDEECYRDYAEELLPRAVGYSAALLNYFFRGTLEISTPDINVYGLADGSKKPYQQFTKIRAKVKNITANGEAMGPGILQAVARYRIIPNYAPDLSTYPPSSSVMSGDGTTQHPPVQYSYSVSASQPVASLNSTAPAEFTFDFGQSPIPVGITDLTLQVIFKGTLGNETNDAIAVGMKDLSEPTHLVFWNLTDEYIYGKACDDIPGYTCYKAYFVDDINNPNSGHELAGVRTALNNLGITPASSTLTFSFAFKDSVSSSYVNPTVQVSVPPGGHVRLIALVDDSGSSASYLQFDYQGDIYWSPIPGAITRVLPDGSVQATPAESFLSHGEVPFVQHYDDIVTDCYPPLSGGGCPYPVETAPEPKVATPVSFTSVFD